MQRLIHTLFSLWEGLPPWHHILKLNLWIAIEELVSSTRLKRKGRKKASQLSNSCSNALSPWLKKGIKRVRCRLKSWWLLMTFGASISFTIIYCNNSTQHLVAQKTFTIYVFKEGRRQVRRCMHVDCSWEASSVDVNSLHPVTELIHLSLWSTCW